MSKYVVIDLEMCKVPKNMRTSTYHWANETIQIGAVHSSTAFKIKHLQVSNVTGTFSKFSGELDITDKIPSNLTATIEVDSINTTSTKKADFLIHL